MDFGVVMVSLGATCLFASALAREHHRHPWPRSYRQVGVQLVLVWLVFASAIWVAISGEDWLKNGPFQMRDRELAFLLFSLTALGLLSYWHSLIRPSFFRARNLRTIPSTDLPSDEKLEALILCVSRPSHQKILLAPDEQLPAGKRVMIHFPAQKGYPGPEVSLCGVSLKIDIEDISQQLREAIEKTMATDPKPAKERPAIYWNWQPLMRAIEPHPNLRRIWLIGSPGDNGSFKHLPLCVKFLEQYGKKVEWLTVPVDFEDFNQVEETIRHLLTKELAGIPAYRIAVDITGGQKPTSVAVAAMTMNRELRFQYIQTNPPFHAMTYQLAFEEAPGPHRH